MMFKVDVCPVCGGLEREYMLSKRGANTQVLMDLYACLGCSHLYFDPMPDQQFLDTVVYGDSKMFETGGMTAEKRYGTMIDHIQELCPPPATLLDYGSGNGELAKHLAAIGYTVHCFEPSQFARDTCGYGGMTVYANANNIPWDYYDVVIAIEVVEHCLTPGDLFTHVRQCLKPGGLFYYTTGLFDVLESICRYIHPEQHLNFFTTKSARKAIEIAGLDVHKGDPTTAWPIGVKPIEGDMDVL